MDRQAKNSHQEVVSKDFQSEMNAADVMSSLSVEELKKRSDSMIENIGALRFAIARIEVLDARRVKLEQGLTDAIKVLRTLPDLAPYEHAKAALHGA